MTTETTAFMIGYGFFLLITAFLVFAWRREQMRNQELFKEKGDLIDENLKSLDIVKESLQRVKQLAFERIDLRKQFIEQSELATSWRQKHDKLQIDYNRCLEAEAAWEQTMMQLVGEDGVGSVAEEIRKMQSELDRGNEMITWMKAYLEKARELNRKNEMVIMNLLSTGKFTDEKGVYRKNYLSKNGENLPLGEYIDSMHRSMIAKHFFDNKRTPVESPNEPRPDHPCLKGCSKPYRCDCPASAPKDGTVDVVHTRKDLVTMGVNMPHTPTWLEDEPVIKNFAKSRGMTFKDTNGGNVFFLSRPAVNSDFDVPNANG